MNFERRDFIRASAAGLAGSIFGFEPVFGQTAQKDEEHKSVPTAELTDTASSLYLSLKARAGALDVHFHEFSHGRDHGTVARGTFKNNTGTTTRLYRSLFIVEGSQQVFARRGDDDSWLSVVLARTDEEDEKGKKDNVESLTVLQDKKAAQTFRMNKENFIEALRTKGVPNSEQYIINPSAGVPHFERSKVEITTEELEDAFENNREYLAFRRGVRPPRQHATMMTLECGFLERLICILFGVDWDA